MRVTDINKQVYDYYKQSTTRIGRRCFDYLDREAVGTVVEQDGTFWIEWAQHQHPLPDAVVTHIIKTVINLTKWKYLYEDEL